MNIQFQGESNASQELLSHDRSTDNDGELRRDGTGTRSLRKGFKLAWSLNDNELDLPGTNL